MSHATAPHFLVQAPGGPLAVQRWGQPDHPVIVLVHGYPDNRRKWDAVAQLLSDQYQVIAYDVRGAGDSFKPTGRANYRLDQLTQDFTAVINAVSPRHPVHLVGHDWGSVQGWEFVTEPALKGRIASFTSCSGPSLDHFGHWLQDRLRRPTLSNLAQAGHQMLKSWYVYLFQLPWVPEALWHLGLGRNWPQVMRWLESVDIAPRATQTSDGTHGVNLYRANVLQRTLSPRLRYAHAPVQVLVPMKDRFISPALTRELSRWVPQLTRVEIDAGHWVSIQQPALFAGRVRAFIESLTERHH